jgi:CBS domain-containing protein
MNIQRLRIQTTPIKFASLALVRPYAVALDATTGLRPGISGPKAPARKGSRERGSTWRAASVDAAKAMKVRDLHLQPVLATNPDESLRAVADRMRFYEVGSLVVLESGRPVGLITERDLTRSVADSSDPDQITVRFYMTARPMIISAEADIREAKLLMEALGTRHLPVVDKGRLSGMISTRDVLRAVDPPVADGYVDPKVAAPAGHAG